jgi:hypothetical protein
VVCKGKKQTMKKLVGLALVLAACGGDSKPSQQDSFLAFGVATQAMAQAQSKAIQAAQQGNIVAPAVLTLNYNGPCTTGGTVSVTGSYDNAGSGQAATFDMNMSFDACADAQGTLDGDMHWTSTADGTNYTATMKGDIDFVGPQASASCEYNLTVSVTGSAATYSGTVCGYNISQGR